MEAAALGIADPSCYNAFSAGASNAANPVAPLVGSGSITASEGILLAIAAIGLWGFTIARRTLDTVGEGLTDHPILVAMFVSLIGATIITILSDLGVPASLAVSMNLLGPFIRPQQGRVAIAGEQLRRTSVRWHIRSNN